jgi:hypothetical protein
MVQEEKAHIYDRLLGIKLKIEVQSIPNPRYINEMIGECHRYIEEVENFMFQVSKEISANQQALNNATIEFETKKENLLIKDESIKSLPNIKDREAKANSMLKENTEKIRGYQNEVTDLNNLLKAINLKMKNLNRANADIKTQLRVMEAQVKLGSGPGTDAAMRSLMEEMGKSQINKDIFEGSSTVAEETKIADPTQPLDITSILAESESEDDENEEETEEETITAEEPSWKSFSEKSLTVSNEEESPVVDLDKVIEEVKGGIEPQKAVEQITNPIVTPQIGVKTESEAQKSGAGKIDINDLLTNLIK